MNDRIEGLIQDIGFELTDWLGDDLQDALVMAECEDGVSSVEVFFRDAKTGKLKLKSASDELDDLFYTLWEEWPEDQEKWRAAEYILRNGEVELELIYAENFDEELNDFQRRDQSAKKYFGDEPVDYSDPD